MSGRRKHQKQVGPFFRAVDATLLGQDSAPSCQGDLDGLCGLYAAINALCLVLGPLRILMRKEKRALFRSGVEFLQSTGRLDEFIIDGIDPEVWFQLLNHLADVAAAAANYRIHVSRPLRRKGPPTPARLFGEIEKAITLGRPVLISLAGVHDHYTVVRGYSPFSIWLYDSGNLQRLGCESIGVQAGRNARHVIDPCMVTVVKLSVVPMAKTNDGAS